MALFLSRSQADSILDSADTKTFFFETSLLAETRLVALVSSTCTIRDDDDGTYDLRLTTAMHDTPSFA